MEWLIMSYIIGDSAYLIFSTVLPVMLNYAGEFCEYCDACQAAVTVIRSSDAALKSCLERLTMGSRGPHIVTYWVIGDSAYLIFSAVLQTDGHV